MNATENMNGSPRVKRESKNRIRVDFERAPLKERLKARVSSLPVKSVAQNMSSTLSEDLRA